ncbi:MAG TPA: ABC transporter substrate-binding protein, partial [bacterium]|nr:ABC transporter substrate-binding protein [bacterium]
PEVVVKKLGQSGSYNITLNTKKPPFDSLKVRQAVNYAMDRSSFLKAEQGNAAEGGVLLSPPYSKWGLTHEQLAKLPGWGDGAKDKAMARKLLADAGYGPGHPLKVVVSTRAVPLYEDMAVWVIDQLHQVGIESTLEEVESALWFGKMERGEYQIAANMVGQGADDPDSNFFENYTCGSPRNYSFYCNKDVEEMMVKESEELNAAKRLRLVREVDERLQIEVARSMLGQALDYVMYAPWVKGYTPHNNIYNYGRMQNVWLDR